MDKKDKTIATYNASAKELAKFFDSLGTQKTEIEEVFNLVNNKENPKVIEIGCGNGRDSEEIIKRTNDYLGFDISEELIKIAKQKVPRADFQVADVLTFQFPNNIDIVFAMASFLHLSKEEFRMILEKIYKSLNRGGIIYITLKYGENYKEVEQEDKFGIRTFYFYSKEDVQELSKNFKILKLKLIKDGIEWLLVTLQKE